MRGMTFASISTEMEGITAPAIKELGPVEIIIDLRKMKRTQSVYCSVAVSDHVWEEVGFRQNLKSHKTFTVNLLKTKNLRESTFYSYFLSLIDQNKDRKIRIVSDKYCLTEGEHKFKYGFLFELDLNRTTNEGTIGIDSLVKYLTTKI